MTDFIYESFTKLQTLCIELLGLLHFQIIFLSPNLVFVLGLEQ